MYWFSIYYCYIVIKGSIFSLTFDSKFNQLVFLICFCLESVCTLCTSAISSVIWRKVMFSLSDVVLSPYLESWVFCIEKIPFLDCIYNIFAHVTISLCQTFFILQQKLQLFSIKKLFLKQMNKIQWMKSR